MPEQQQRSWLGRNWVWIVPVGCLIPVVLCGGFFMAIVGLVFGVIKSSEPYTASLAAAKENAEVRQHLGVPIEPGFFVTGSIDTSGTSGHADISYQISGPAGSGTVYAIADLQAGEWTFTTLVVEIDESGERLDLLSLLK